MKSAVAALSLFMLGSYAAAVPEPTKVGGTTPTVVARAALATYSGSCLTQVDGPGTCQFSAAGGSQSKPCGVNYKCKFDGESCHYNSSGDHAHCNL